MVLPPSHSHTCYVLNTGDGHDAVFVNAVAAPGQLLALLVSSSAFVHVHEVGTPLLGHIGGRLHALLLSDSTHTHTETHTPNYVTVCLDSFSDMCRPDKKEVGIVP